ncbi:MAG: chorismate lyase [Rhodoferax sp.]|nr:chorismate lyase [Rhodoferax sp.]
MRSWLAAPGSLSAHLRAVGGLFTVQVLDQGRRAMREHEARALSWARSRVAYVREVMLRVDGEPVVFARSVTPHAQSQGAWRAIRGLGARPLADLLFGRAGMARTTLEFARLPPGSPMRHHVAQHWRRAGGGAPMRRSLPARRSVFTRQGLRLLVMEVFAAQRNPWGWAVSRRRVAPNEPSRTLS